ncbi:MAG: hypothetical protein H7A55_18880 [Verrucomicrobiaceae bacterium]|nr:hypothetical protein [Verrucomicrobiaceae bacterium]
MNRPSWRRKRVKRGGSDVFHVMSRTCGGSVFFDEMDKEALVIVMRKLARFCGLELLTYCVMGNHFHALIRVPQQATWLDARFGGPTGEERLFAHMRFLYSKDHVEAVQEDLAKLRATGMDALADSRIEAIKRRMCDVSEWMREVKVRFSRWFNRRHERKGTLWMGRFKSVLVEDKEQVGRRSNELPVDIARVMAAYIDLNPVRARLVVGAESYRWSGWGAALCGDAEAIAGLCAILHCHPRDWATQGKRRYAKVVSERWENQRPEPDTLLRRVPSFSSALELASATADGRPGLVVGGMPLRVIRRAGGWRRLDSADLSSDIGPGS